ncbi:MAG: MFS transporter [Chloroflexota bacterium]
MTGIEAVPEQPGRLGRLGRVSLLAPLAGRDYRFVWIGESVSLLGDQFNTIALAWLVLGLTGSGFALGVILIAAAIPRGTFLLVGGVLSDRISPRDLALVSNVARAVLTTLVAGLVIGDRVELWHLAAVGVVFGTVDAVFLPAINTLVPRLVPVERLAAANAVMQGTAQLVGTVGPAIAGIAVALIGVGAAFVVDAATFAFAALMLWFVRSGGNAPTPQDGPIETRPSILASLVEGGRIVLGDPVMRSIVILSTAANLAFTGSVVVGLPWLVLVRFGGDALTLGFLFATYGAGSLVGVLAAGSLPHPRRFGSIVLAFVLLAGVGLGAVGLAPSAAVVAVILTAIGALNGWINVVVVAWVQGRTDPDVLGRTMSFLMLGSVVAAPLSLAIAAIVVDTNATALFLAAGALVIASAAIALANGLQRRMV